MENHFSAFMEDNLERYIITSDAGFLCVVGDNSQRYASLLKTINWVIGCDIVELQTTSSSSNRVVSFKNYKIILN